MALALQALIGTATDRLRITTAYFRPPRHFRQLLCETAARGVQVQILLLPTLSARERHSAGEYGRLTACAEPPL